MAALEYTTIADDHIHVWPWIAAPFVFTDDAAPGLEDTCVVYVPANLADLPIVDMFTDTCVTARDEGDGGCVFYVRY